MWPGCGGPGSQGSVSAARRVGWSGPDGEEFALDKSASAEAEAPAELLTAVVGGTSRRNVLGAIASKRTIATSRGEATTTDSEPTTRRREESRNPRAQRTPGKRGLRPALPLRSHPEGSRFRLTSSFRNGHIARTIRRRQIVAGNTGTRPRARGSGPKTPSVAGGS